MNNDLGRSANVSRRPTRGFMCHPFAGARLRGFHFSSIHPVLKHWAVICRLSGPVFWHWQRVPLDFKLRHYPAID
jgi:hypothetical protein